MNLPKRKPSEKSYKLKSYQEAALDCLKSRIYARIEKEFENGKGTTRVVDIFDSNWKVFRNDLSKIKKSGNSESWLFVYMMSRFTNYCPPETHRPLFDLLVEKHNMQSVPFSDIRVRKPLPTSEERVVVPRRKRKKKPINPFFIPQRSYFSNGVKLPDMTMLKEFSVILAV